MIEKREASFQVTNPVTASIQLKQNTMYTQEARKTAISIVNSINEKYSLALKTVDASAMTDDIVCELVDKVPVNGRFCIIQYDGVPTKSLITYVTDKTFSVVTLGTEYTVSNIPIEKFKPA